MLKKEIMKKIVFIALLVNVITGYSQELLSLGRTGANLDLEFPDEFPYIKIDTNHVWYITMPNKYILYYPPDPGPFGTHALITDTSLYYKSNIKSSFQFKLIMGEEGNTYRIEFEHKYDFEKNKDGGIIETSYNNGITWQNIIFDTIVMNHIYELNNLYTISDTTSSFNNQPGYTGTLGSMSLVYIDFYPNENLRGDTMTLRFTFASDSNDTENEGWLLDNFHFGGQFWEGINDQYNPEIRIYPNQTGEKLELDTENNNISLLEIYSLTGQLLLKNTSENITSVDISSLNKGIYVIVIKSDNNFTWFSKFCKI
jgi:hypothetical protein